MKYVYILESLDSEHFYIGIADDLRARLMKHNAGEVGGGATVGIGPRSAGGFGLDVELAVSLPGLARDEAEALVEATHQICPYSNATRGNIDVRSTIV